MGADTWDSVHECSVNLSIQKTTHQVYQQLCTLLRSVYVEQSAISRNDLYLQQAH